MKKFGLCTLIFFFLFCGTNALAVPFGFEDIPSTKDDIDISDNFAVEVEDIGGNQVQFSFTNEGDVDSSISGIYWDDLLGLLSILDEPAFSSEDSTDTVYFAEDDKAKVPQGKELDPGFDADIAYLAAEYKSAGIKKKDAGVDLGESATFILGGDFEEVLAALNSGNLRIAIKAEGIIYADLKKGGKGGKGGNDSYITSSVTPVPEPATMLLLGAGLIGIAGLGRKKLFKKK